MVTIGGGAFCLKVLELKFHFLPRVGGANAPEVGGAGLALTSA